MWPDSRLIDLLGIRHPILQAPMLGSTTPALVAAVSGAGALGAMGCTRMGAEEIAAFVAAMRGATNGAFNLNFFAHPEPVADPRAVAAARARLAPFYDRAGLGAVPETLAAPYPGFSAPVLEALLAARPPVVSFHFGLPPGDAVARLKAAGIRVLSTATTVAEARALEAGGADAVIAQGWEAGGHRGAFGVEPEDAGVGLMALVPQVADAVRVPVIAAGGIMDGRGIAAALALGAAGVQMGTAFLTCPEASVPQAHRDAVTGARDDDTVLTAAVSGRPARARRSAYARAMRGADLPAFPLMYTLSAPLLAGSEEAEFLLYGQAAGMARPMPAGRLVETLAAEAQARLAGLSGRGTGA
jgi:nitronate monooxygenase